jgi:hypothetical protein
VPPEAPAVPEAPPFAGTPPSGKTDEELHPKTTPKSKVVVRMAFMVAEKSKSHAAPESRGHSAQNRTERGPVAIRPQKFEPKCPRCHLYIAKGRVDDSVATKLEMSTSSALRTGSHKRSRESLRARPRSAVLAAPTRGW